MNFEHPEETALRGIEAHEAFLREIGMPVTLHEIGAKTEDIPALTAHVRRNPGTDTVGRAWPIDTAQIERVFRIADR